MQTGDRQLMKEMNVTAVITGIREHEPISRVGIARLTGLSKATVTGITQMLLHAGLILETGSADSTGGRPPTLLRLNPTARLAVGVKIAPASITAALTSLQGQILEKTSVALPGESQKIVPAVEESVRNVMRQAGFSLSADRLLGVGVALPGIVDPNTGLSISSYFLRWQDVPLKQLLEARLGVPVYPENDANCFALGEYWYGAGRGASSLLGLTVGVGIGAGLILDGRLFRGSLYGAGEVGHMVVQRDGPLCNCGRFGCLEALAADAAVAQRARQLKADRQAYPGGRPEVVAAAVAGDAAARQALAEAGEWIGLGLANLVNLASCDFIVVGGEAVSQAGDLLLQPIRAAFQRYVFSPLAGRVRVEAGELGDDVWLIGATVLALQHFFHAPLAVALTQRGERGDTGLRLNA